MRTAIVLVAISILAITSGLPLAHATFTVSPKANITSTVSNWQYEWPWQSKTFYAQGLYWIFYRTHTGATQCTTGASLCTFMAYSTNGQAWGGGLAVNFAGPTQYTCGQDFATPGSITDLTVITNGTHVFYICDSGTTLSSGALPGAVYMAIGKLVNTGGVGTITWGTVHQINGGFRSSTGFYNNEVIKVTPNNNIFVAYTIDNLNSTQSLAYVAVSTNQGVTWAITQLNATAGHSASSGTIGYGWEVHLVAYADNTVLAFYDILTGDITVKGGTNIFYRTYSGGWSAGARMTPSDLPDGVDPVDNAYIDSLGVYHWPNATWIDYPTPGVVTYGGVFGTPGGLGWGTPCGYQDCVRLTWYYNELTATWSDREIVDNRRVWDEHSQIFYEPVTNTVYLMLDDISCITQPTPGEIFMLTKAGPTSGSWQAIPGTRIIAQANMVGDSQGGGTNLQGCPAPNNQNCGCFTAFWNAAMLSPTSSTFGFSWTENLNSPFSIEYATLSFTPGSQTVVFGTETKTVLFIDDFLYTNPLAASPWTIDVYNGTNPNIYTSSGYLTMQSGGGPCCKNIAAHVTNPIYDPSTGVLNTIIKRKMTVALIPFDKTVSGSPTVSFRTGMGPLILSTQAYPGANPTATPAIDPLTNCISPTGPDNNASEYINIDNAGNVALGTCGNGAGNHIFNWLTLNLQLYTVLTIESRGIFCHTCSDNALTNSSWVFFRVYQTNNGGAIVADKSMNITTGIAPLAVTTYAWLFQGGNGLVKTKTLVDIVQVQNYGSPVCLVAPSGEFCTRLPPVPPGIIGNNGIVGTIAFLANLVGGGDEQLGAIVLFFIVSFGFAIVPFIFTRHFIVLAFGELLSIGFYVYAGFFPEWVLVGVFVATAILLVMTFAKFFGGASSLSIGDESG